MTGKLSPPGPEAVNPEHTRSLGLKSYRFVRHGYGASILGTGGLAILLFATEGTP